MIARLLVPLLFCIFALTQVIAAPALQRQKLLGTWEFQQSGALNSFTGYTTYQADGTCLQIGRGKTLGMTKWIYVETRWRLDGDQLVASATSSNIVPKGKSASSRVVRLTDSEFTYREDGDNADRTERRVARVPSDFLTHLAELQQKAAGK